MLKPFIPAGRSNYYIRFTLDGREAFKSLNTRNRAEALERAKTAEAKIMAGDTRWLHPRAAANAAPATLGEIVTAYESWSRGNERARKNNVLQLLRIVSPDTSMPKNASKADRTDAACNARRTLALAKSSEVCDAASIATHITAGLDQKRSGSSINSDIRQARAIFSKKAQRHYSQMGLKMPKTLAEFLAADLVDCHDDHTYVPIPRPQLAALDKEIASLKGANLEMWKTLSLVRRCALRNSEIFAARREWLIETDAGPALAVRNADGFASKNGQGAEILIDAELAAVLSDVPAGKFLVLPGEEVTKTARANFINRASNRVVRKYLPGRVKGIYELRKEAGSWVATHVGLYAAQQLLRHKSQRVTESNYATSLNRPTAIVPGVIPA